MEVELTKEKLRNSFTAMREEFKYTSPMAAPRLLKIVIATGIGKVTDKNRVALIEDRLSKITGQKPSPRGAKKSIASFKTRQGQIIGMQVTLRGARAYDFLDRLINIALPRTKDFRGIARSTIDEMGNLTIGVREHTIFSETSDEDIRDIFGLAITIVTSARNKKEAAAFYTHLGIPFKKK